MIKESPTSDTISKFPLVEVSVELADDKQNLNEDSFLLSKLS
jgi:hypothetical protein